MGGVAAEKLCRKGGNIVFVKKTLVFEGMTRPYFRWSWKEKKVHIPTPDDGMCHFGIRAVQNATGRWAGLM